MAKSVEFRISLEHNLRDAAQGIKLLREQMKLLSPIVSEVKKEWQSLQRSVTMSQRHLQNYVATNEQVSKSVKGLTGHLSQNEEGFKRIGRAAQSSMGMMGSLGNAASQSWGMLAAKIGAAYLIIKHLRESYAPRFDVAASGGVAEYERLAASARAAGISVRDASALYSQFQRTSAHAQFGMPQAPGALTNLQTSTRAVGAETSSRLIMDVLGKMDFAQQRQYLAAVQSGGAESATRQFANVGNIRETSSLLNAMDMERRYKAGTLPPEMQAAVASARAQEAMGVNIEKLTDSIASRIAPAVERIAQHIENISPGRMLAEGAALWGGSKLLGAGITRGIPALARYAVSGAPSSLSLASAGTATSSAISSTIAALGTGVATASIGAIAATVLAGGAIGATIGTLIDQYAVKPWQEGRFEKGQDAANKKTMEETDRIIAGRRGISVEQLKQHRADLRAARVAQAAQTAPQPDNITQLQKQAQRLETLGQESALLQARSNLIKQSAELEKYQFGFSESAGRKQIESLDSQLKLLRERYAIESGDKSHAGQLKALQTETEINATLIEQKRLRDSMPRERFGAMMEGLGNEAAKLRAQYEAQKDVYGFGDMSAQVDKLNDRIKALREEETRLQDIPNRTHEQQQQLIQSQTERIEATRERDRMIRESPRERYSAQMAQQNAILQREQSRLNAMRADIVGAAGTPMQTMRIVGELDSKLGMIRKRYEELNAVKQRTHEQDLEMIDLETQSNDLVAQKKQMLRELQGGYLNAIEAQAIGAGRFERILVTQDANMGAALRGQMAKANLMLGNVNASIPRAESFRFGTDMGMNVQGLSSYAALQGARWNAAPSSGGMPPIPNVATDTMSGYMRAAGELLIRGAEQGQRETAENGKRWEQFGNPGVNRPPMKITTSLQDGLG